MTGLLSGRFQTFNWTRIHLIYFVLAGFDIAAIAAGLWLSDRMIDDYRGAMTSVEGGLVLHEHVAHLHEATTDLTAPLNDLFSHGNVGQARAVLTAAAEAFETESSEEKFLAEIGDGTQTKFDTASHNADHDVDAFARALGISNDIAIRYESLETAIREAGAQIVAKSEQAFKSYEQGDRSAAAVLLGEMNTIARAQQHAIGRLIATSDDHVRTIVERGKRQVVSGGKIESLFGAIILLIVGLVIAYGHFVGRMLRKKYDELESSRAEAQEVSDLLHGVNNEVLRLNVELSENLRKLTAAQDENVRRGRMAQLGHLTATVAHELRNPLGAVRTSAFLLERKLKGSGLGVEAQLQRINKGILRCDNIISQLLDYSRTRPPVLEDVKIDDWLASLVQEEAEKLPATVSIECELGLGALTSRIDPARMRRVLVNLLANASEAMVGNGEDLAKAGTRSPRITVSTRMTQRGVEISIRDSGPGIAPDVLERVLEPLFTTKNFGTGLGLPAAEKVLAEHHGGLEIESALGQGATFTAWFPVGVAGAAAA